MVNSLINIGVCDYYFLKTNSNHSSLEVETEASVKVATCCQKTLSSGDRTLPTDCPCSRAAAKISQERVLSRVVSPLGLGTEEGGQETR